MSMVVIPMGWDLRCKGRILICIPPISRAIEHLTSSMLVIHSAFLFFKLDLHILCLFLLLSLTFGDI